MADNMMYLVRDGALTRMQPSAPATEDQMQALVARHPEIITDADGELLLVRREQPISDAAESSGRWSVDHLFVTREAVPVLVELKRAVDTRLRREVVGQMLDYAANAAAYWRAGTIAAAFAETAQARGEVADEVLREFLGDADAAAFWQQVDANFAAGRLKLVFVADVIPRELARIVEFMNEQMKADVRAVELRWFEGDGGLTTLAPRVIGATERAAAQKSATRAPLVQMTRDEWIGAFIAPGGEDAIAGARTYIDMIEALGGEVIIAKTQGSLASQFRGADGKLFYPFHLWRSSGGYVTLSFAYLTTRVGLADAAVRQMFYDQLTGVVGKLSTANIGGYPGFSVVKLATRSAAAAVEQVFHDVVSTAA